MASKVFISGIDTTLSYHIVEKLRKDHIMLQNYPIFEGSVNNIKENIEIENQEKIGKRKNIHKSVHKILNINNANQNKSIDNFKQSEDEKYYGQKKINILQIMKSVLQADLIILNLRNPTPQIQFILKILKFYSFDEHKKIKIIGLSTHMTWANTRTHCIRSLSEKQSSLDASLNQDYWNRLSYTSQSYKMRVPHPQFVYNYQLQESLLQLFQSKNKNISGYVLGCGLLYGRQSIQLYEVIKPAIDAKENTIYGEGNNVIPLFNIDCLISIIQYLSQNQINENHKKYFLLTQNSQQQYQSFKPSYNGVTQQMLVDLIKKKVGNKCQNIIKPINELVLLKNQLIWSSNVKFELDETIRNILKSYSLVSNFQQSLDNTIKQFYEYCDQAPKHFYIPVQLDYQDHNLLNQIKKKYYFFDYIKLTDLILKLTKQKIIQIQCEEQQKKKSSQNSRKSSLVNNQPHKAHVKIALQHFIITNLYSNYAINLKKQYFDLISQQLRSNGMQDNKWVNQNQQANTKNNLRLIVKANQKLRQCDIQLNSKEFLLCFNLSCSALQQGNQSQSQTELSQSDLTSKNQKRSSKANNNVQSNGLVTNSHKQINQQQPSDQNKKQEQNYNFQTIRDPITINKNTKTIKTINNKNHSKKQSNLHQNNSHSFSLVTQYLLDNLILYVAQARHTINLNSKFIQKQNRVEQPLLKGVNQRNSKAQRPSKLKLLKEQEQIQKLSQLVESLKQIRNRQNLELTSQIQLQN